MGSSAAATVEQAQAKVAVATAVVAGVMTILMGVVANYPLALAAGLGLNVFVTFGIAKLPGMTWEDAMGLVVLEGLVLVVLVLTGFRTAVFHAVPPSLRIAISVGIGLFITIIGFVDSGFVRRTAVGPVPVELGVGGSLQGWPTIVFLVGLIVIAALLVRAVRGALLIGILVSTVLAFVVEAVFHVGPSVTASGDPNPTGWGLNVPTLPDQILATPDLDLLGRFSLLGSFRAIGVAAAVLLVFTLIVADFFDTMGTMVAVGAEGALLDADGVPPNADRILLVDSLAAAAGGAASVSSNTAYIESTAGVAEGARTGVASIVTGVLFLVAAVFAPLVRIVPVRGRRPGARHRRLRHDAPGPVDRLGRRRGRHPRLPHHRRHAVHLLDHRRHRRGLRHLRDPQGGARQVVRGAPADVVQRRPVRRVLRDRPGEGAARGQLTGSGPRVTPPDVRSTRYGTSPSASVTTSPFSMLPPRVNPLPANTCGRSMHCA